MASRREDSNREERAIRRGKWVNELRGSEDEKQGESEKMEITKEEREGRK